MPVKPIPNGYRSITPYLAVRQAAEAIEFYRRAFGAKERMRIGAPDGKVGHAELEIGDSVVMLADEVPDMEFLGPPRSAGRTVHASPLREGRGRELPQGHRCRREGHAPGAGPVLRRPHRLGRDPFGHVWHIATHKEDVAPEELARRTEAMFKRQAKG